MSRRHVQQGAVWLVGLALACAGPSAAAQEKNRTQQFIDLSRAFQLSRPASGLPADQVKMAQEQLAGLIAKFIDAEPADNLSYQALGMLCGLQHGEVQARTVQHVLKHHLKNPNLPSLIVGQWTTPTPTRSALLKQLATAPDLPEQDRGFACLMLARDTYQLAGETGDRDLARHAQRYADQYEKLAANRPFPNNLVNPISVAPVLDAIRKFNIGQPAPKTETQTVMNNAFKMENLRGKVVLVYFYTGPSTQYTKVRAYLEPHLARLKGRPVALVMVASTSPALLARKVQMDAAPPAAVLSSINKKGGLNNQPLQKEWGAYSFPTAVLVDAQGAVRFRFTVPPGTPFTQEPAFLQRLDAALDRLVGEVVQK